MRSVSSEMSPSQSRTRSRKTASGGGSGSGQTSASQWGAMRSSPTAGMRRETKTRGLAGMGRVRELCQGEVSGDSTCDPSGPGELAQTGDRGGGISPVRMGTPLPRTEPGAEKP